MLARAHRFHGLNSLSFAYRQGQTVRTTDMALKYALNTRRKTYRAAVVVSKKVHKSAVVRNRIRRRVYEAIRLHQPALSQAYDLIFTVHQDTLAELPAAELSQRVDRLLHQAQIR